MRDERAAERLRNIALELNKLRGDLEALRKDAGIILGRPSIQVDHNMDRADVQLHRSVNGLYDCAKEIEA